MVMAPKPAFPKFVMPDKELYLAYLLSAIQFQKIPMPDKEVYLAY
jgi:hypothetical protein